MMNIHQILKQLPHRYPILLVDRGWVCLLIALEHLHCLSYPEVLGHLMHLMTSQCPMEVGHWRDLCSLQSLTAPRIYGTRGSASTKVGGTLLIISMFLYHCFHLVL